MVVGKTAELDQVSRKIKDTENQMVAVETLLSFTDKLSLKGRVKFSRDLDLPTVTYANSGDLEEVEKNQNVHEKILENALNIEKQ